MLPTNHNFSGAESHYLRVYKNIKNGFYIPNIGTDKKYEGRPWDNMTFLVDRVYSNLTTATYLNQRQ